MNDDRVEAPVPAPLRLHEAVVQPAWVDYNRHMSESCYLLAFGDNADAFFRYIGIDAKYRAEGHSLYTVETHLHHRREVSEGESLSMTLRVLGHDAKRVHVFHEMFLGDSDELVATAEQMLIHVDSRAGRAAAMPQAVGVRLESIRRAHAELVLPEVVGRPMGINRPRREPWTSN